MPRLAVVPLHREPALTVQLEVSPDPDRTRDFLAWLLAEAAAAQPVEKGNAA